MPRRIAWTTPCVVVLALAATAARAKDKEPLPPDLTAFFKAETDAIASKPLQDVKSAEEWKAKRPEFQRQLREMLGLDPMPPRTDLKVEVRGVVERPDFAVERILYQSSPGLYVSANLYRPKVVGKPLPAVLYVCGHGRVEKDGVIYGSKAHYQHHAAWYAANGYVCLVVDTLELGEVPGHHHGTYRRGRWWWQSRGYTPAGVEVWNGIRGLDYLCSRPEVDPDRLGVAGRSGGGAMSWYLGAVDDRLKVVIPAAGITDLQDHVVNRAPNGPNTDGVIDGHCDCMFFVNTYRWDYTMLAALVAPKALLFENTHADPIFPEPGVRRIFKQLENVYGWYGARDRLDLIVGDGGHVDSEELRHPEFAWFEKHFKGDAAQPLDAIQEPDRAVPIELLKVLEPGKPLPENVNDTIDESFVPRAIPPAPTAEAWNAIKDRLRAEAVAKAFPSPFHGPKLAYPWRDVNESYVVKAALGMKTLDFEYPSWPYPTQRLWAFHDPDVSKVAGIDLVVMTAEDWKRYAPLIDAFEGDADPSGLPEFAEVKAKANAGTMTALFAPLGIGRTAWPASRDVSVRRRFALLGLTLDGCRVAEVRQVLRGLQGLNGPPVTLIARGEAAPVALWAAALEKDHTPARIVLQTPPATVRDGPAFLNLGRILDMPQALGLLHPADVRIEASPESAWSWTRALAESLGAARPWPEIVP